MARSAMARISLRRVWRGAKVLARTSVCVVTIGVTQLSALSLFLLTEALERENLSRAARKQVGFDKLVQVAGEHRIDITALHPGARVFDQAVGRKHVTAYL